MQISLGLGGGGSGRIDVLGDGPLYHHNGQFFAQPHIARGPLSYLDPDGIQGPPILTLQPGYFQIGKLIGANGAITTDQLISIVGAAEYTIDKIIVCHATAVPVAMQGGIYTLPNKAGDAVVASSQTYVALGNQPYDVMVITPSVALRAAPFLYLSLTTPNGAALTFDVLVYGTVTKTPSDPSG